MPLFHKDKQEFQPSDIPEGVGPDTEVFYVPSTKEVFLDYDAYFERMMLLNSSVWVCNVTGKSGLTFDEAKESEAEALKQVQSFPAYLELPILYLIHTFSCRSRIDDLVNDIYAFMKDRYFINEELKFKLPGRKKKTSRVLAVKYHDKHKPQAESDSDIEILEDPKKEGEKSSERPKRKSSKHNGSPYKQKPNNKDDKHKINPPEAPAPECYTYRLQIIEDEENSDSESSTSSSSDDSVGGTYDDVKHTLLSRDKSTASQQHIKLFIRYCTEREQGQFVVKGAYISDLLLDNVQWKDVFAGPPPKFQLTRKIYKSEIRVKSLGEDTQKKKDKKTEERKRKSGMPEMNGHGPQIGIPDSSISCSKTPTSAQRPSTSKRPDKAELKRRQIREQQEKLKELFDAAKRYGMDNIEKWQQQDHLLSEEDIQQLRDDVKEAKQNAKAYEKQQAKERRRREKEEMLERCKPRDDLYCDDLKPLPKYQELLLPSWIPKDLYSDLLSLHNFFCCFSSLLPENTGKPLFTLGELASAVVSSSVENTRLVDIFKVLLRARADVVKSEDGDEANLYKYEEIGYEANGDLEHHVHGKRIRDANKKHARVRRCHGVNVSDLEVNDMTISEVLRLTLETSGYYPVGGRRMERLEFRGGIRCYEDDGYLFALNNPKTMEKLKEKSLLQITPKERMNILNALVQQLLSYKKYREYMHDRMTHIEELRKHLRKLHHLAEMQEKQVQHSLQMKKAEGKPMESKSVSNIKNWLYRTKDSVKENDPPPNAIDNSPTKMLDESTKLADTEKTTVSKELQNLQGYLQQVTEQQNVGDKRKILESIPYTELKSAQISEFRELQKQIYEEELNEVQTELYSEQAAMGMCFLGRDRAFRSYFFLHTFGLLLIENPDQCTVGYCDQVSPIVISQPTNVVVKIKKLSSPCECKNVLDYENERIRRYCCTGSPDTCPVHKTKSDSHRFFYYVERDGVENLLNALNPRGCREIDLIESLTLLKDKYARKINENAEKADAIDFLSVCFEVSPEFAEEIESVDDFMESNFIKEILQQEETIFKKRFGDVSISLSCSREIWRKSLQEQKSTSTLCKDKYLPIHQNKSANDYVLYTAEELKSEELTSVEKLGIALLQLVHGMRFETEILGYPFENPGRKKGEYIAWQQDLAACQSHSALHLFLATFLKSVNWDYVVPVPDSKNRQPKQHLFTGMTLRSRRPITSGTYKEYLTSDEEDVDSKNNQKTQKSRSPSHLDFLTDEASDSEENGSISARRVENKKLRENNQPAKEFLASDSDSTDSWHSKRKQHKYTQMSLRNKNPVKYK